MIKVIAFEGIDCSGKTTTLRHLSDKLGEESKFCFDDGVVFPGELSNMISLLSSSCNSIEKEILYTMGYVFDGTKSVTNSPEGGMVHFRDRYWPSVVAYGRFLNEKESIHNHIDFRPLFILPISIILLSCSYDEVIRRIEMRTNKSRIDNILLKEPSQFRRLEDEINRSIERLPNVIKIDTTGITVEDVAHKIITYLQNKSIL